MDTYNPHVARQDAAGAWRLVPDPEYRPGPVVGVEAVPLARRPSWPARMQFLTMPTAAEVRHRGGDLIDQAVAEWFTARARRRFVEALWADEASAV